jgi:hypothetical protein
MSLFVEDDTLKLLPPPNAIIVFDIIYVAPSLPSIIVSSLSLIFNSAPSGICYSVIELVAMFNFPTRDHPS